MLYGYNYLGIHTNAMFRLSRKRLKKHLAYVAITEDDFNKIDFIFEF